MLLQFSVSNYRCFRELQTLNLAASSQDKDLPGNCFASVAPTLDGKRWVKGAAIYGANASGKTTILNALEALSGMVTESAKMTDPEEWIPQIEPFAFCTDSPENPTAFSIAFVANAIRYEYRVAATRTRIWHESLRAFPNRLEQVWFCRDWLPADGTYSWTPERPTGFERDRQLEGYTLSNMLFLSKAIASNRDDLQPVFRWFKEHLRFMDLSARSRFGYDTTLKMLKEQGKLSERIISLLQTADLGVIDAKVIGTPILTLPLNEVPNGEKSSPLEMYIRQAWSTAWENILDPSSYKPELTHRGPDETKWKVSWDSESAGTHRLFGLTGPWLEILSRGSVICIDELESSLHPLLVRELLRLFFSEQDNQNGAQILFTTHNPILLDPTLLRRDQIWFTSKSSEGVANLYPLTDYSPRKGESLIKGYLAGRYGAVPIVPEGLVDDSIDRDPVANGVKESNEPSV